MSNMNRAGHRRRGPNLGSGALPTLLLSALLAGAAAAEDPVTVEYDFTPGAELSLEFEDGGSAFIIGWDEPRAKVTYFDQRGDLDDHQIDIRERRGGLEIVTESARRRHRSQNLVFEISVPREVEVDFSSAGGSLLLRELRGTFEGHSGGGSLSIIDVEGQASLTIGGGSIEIVDCTLDGRVTTGGGEVLVRNVVGGVEVTSGGGEVRYHNVRDHDGELRAPGGLSAPGMDDDTVVISSAGGGIDVRRAPAGAILSTGGGSIDVEDASHFVEATTGGGDIDIRVRDGWVKARTGAGDIHIEVEEGLGDGDEGIDLATGMGAVTVYLPRGLSLDLRLEIRYNRNSRRDYEIDSDLDLEIKHSQRWEYENGGPRKFIRGRATIGDGQHKVRIRSFNGDIRIRVVDR